MSLNKPFGLALALSAFVAARMMVRRDSFAIFTGFVGHFLCEFMDLIMVPLGQNAQAQWVTIITTMVATIRFIGISATGMEGFRMAGTGIQVIGIPA